MNIIYSTEDLKFKDLLAGEAFYFNDDLYMKIDGSTKEHYNYVILKDGRLAEISNDTYVEFAQVNVVAR